MRINRRFTSASNRVIEEIHYVELASLENSYWWHVNKRKLVLSLVSKFKRSSGFILECGVGTGLTLKILKEQGYDVMGLDSSPLAVHFCSKIGLDEVYQIALEDSWPVGSCSVDIVLMLDLLEHLDDPVAVLQKTRLVLKDSGIVVINVPAHQFLMSHWDYLLRHRRRYSKRMLRQQALQSGFHIEMLNYSNCFIFPFALIIHLFQKIKENKVRHSVFPRLPAFLNKVLIGLGNIERLAMLSLTMPWGLSIVAVLKKVRKEK